MALQCTRRSHAYHTRDPFALGFARTVRVSARLPARISTVPVICDVLVHARIYLVKLFHAYVIRARRRPVPCRIGPTVRSVDFLCDYSEG